MDPRESKNAKFGFVGKFVNVEMPHETISTYYIEKGSSDKPALLLLHGLGGTSSNWLFASELSRHFRLVAPDLPGPFLTQDFTRDEDVTLDNAVLFVRLFLDTLGIDSVRCLLGNSMGGFIAIHFTSAYPDMVESLIPIAPGGIDRYVHPLTRIAVWVPDFVFMNQKIWARLAGFFTMHRPKGKPDRLFADPKKMNLYAKDVFDDSDYGVSWIRSMKRASKVGMDRLGQKLSAIKLITSDLEHIRVPLLVIWGNQDNVLKPKHGHRLKEIVPLAKLVLLTHCGHLPHIEQHEIVNRLIEYFLLEPDQFDDLVKARENHFGYLLSPGEATP